MTKIFLLIAAILAGLSVAGGAFASHALASKISERALEIWETGNRYQMYHALAIFLIAVLLSRAEVPQTTLIVAGSAFIVGVFLFSGSLYILSLSGIKWLGAITPLGGVAFLVGWASLAVAAWNWN